MVARSLLIWLLPFLTNGTFGIISEHSRMQFDKGEVTQLLDRIVNGDRSAEEDLMPQVYVELHRLAMSRLRSERPGHTLQATALVHEAYIRLCRSNELKFETRAHFFCLSAQLMRRILVDYARMRGAQKRSDGITIVSLDQAITISTEQSAEALNVDELLNQLMLLSPRQAQIVEMKFYGGLTEPEIAAALKTSARTVRRDWLMARAWLHEQLQRT